MSTYSGFNHQDTAGWSRHTPGSSAGNRCLGPNCEPGDDIKPIAFSLETINPQWACPLFSHIPPEIRSLIFEYALKDYEDKTQEYGDATCYKRPDYLAPRRTDTELLRTCKRIYTEAWYLPWASAEHSFYLAWAARSPPRITEVWEMQRALDILHLSHVEPSIEHVRVFAQLCMLEGGGRLMGIMGMRYFRPRVVTITIRHTDWWGWEQDMPLHCGEKWVNICRFPQSMKELRVAFESLERKKASVDQVAEQAIKKWEFERKDGVIMSAEGCVPSIMQWSGVSTWEGRRWLRDETGPNQLNYYVATVTWRPVVEGPADILPAGAADIQTPEQRKRKIAKPLDAKVEARLVTGMDSVSVAPLEHANVPGAPADEVWRLMGRRQAEWGENEYSYNNQDGDAGYDHDTLWHNGGEHNNYQSEDHEEGVLGFVERQSCLFWQTLILVMAYLKRKLRF